VRRHTCTVFKCPIPTGSQAHCGGSNGCHQTFTAVCHFDAHRIGYVDTRRCVKPSGDTMVIPAGAPDAPTGMLFRQDGLWSTAQGHTERLTASARMMAARAAKGGK
jgi:hypothetical protein